MRMLNIMWSAQPAFRSVHLVMRNVESSLRPAVSNHGFLMGDSKQQDLLSPSFSLHCGKRVIKSRWARWKARRKLRRMLVQFAPDVLILDGLGVARLVLPLVTYIPDCRVLVYFHGQTRFRKTDYKLFAAVDSYQLRLVAVSRSLAEQIQEQLRQFEVLAVPTFLHLPPTLQCIRKTHSVLRLGAVGRLVESKNFSLLIQAVSIARRQGHPVQLEIAGDGPLRDQLQTQIHDLQLEGSVQLLGRLSDMQSFYQCIDLLLVPSLQEGQGLVLQEALHYGVPVFCSALAVFREQLQDAGCYLSKDSPDDWACAIACQSLNDLEDLLVRQRAALYNYCNSDVFHTLLEGLLLHKSRSSDAERSYKQEGSS